MNLRVLANAQKPFTKRPRVGLFGDSRFAGAYMTTASNAPECNLTQLVNRALMGAAVAVTPVFSTTINSSAVSVLNAWRGYSKGGNTIEQNMPFDILADRDQLDIAVIQGGFNNLSAATVTSTSTIASDLAIHNTQLRTSVAYHVSRGRKVVLLTLWGGGSKLESSRTQANTYRRQLAAEYADRGVYLLDIGDTVTKNAAYYASGESPSVHQSVSGAKYIAGQVALKIRELCPTSSLTVSPYAAPTVNAEMGICRFEPFTAATSNLDTTTGFTSIGTTSMFWGKCQAATAPVGTATLSTAAEPNGYGNIQTWSHLSGGNSWINNEYNGNSFATTTYSTGDRLAFEVPILMSGMEAGGMKLHVELRWASGATTNILAYDYQGDDGDWGGGCNVSWGLLYGEVIVPPASATSGAVGSACYLHMTLTQADDSAVAAGHVATVSMKQLSMRNMTTRREFYMGQDLANIPSVHINAESFQSIAPNGSSTAQISFPVVTSTQRDARTKVVGEIVYNSTLSKHQAWDGSTWNSLW